VPPSEKFSILLVDDDPMVIRVFSRILSDYAPLRFATSGRVALKLARESVPDLVMLDVEMPEMSGFEICKLFKSDPRLAEVPIVFVSSHESPELETAGLKLGAADFLSKPPHASLVLARVRTYQQLKSLSDTVRSAVTMDFLTGTCTGRQLEKILAQEWLRAQRSLAPLSLLLANIDGFTAFNAKFGEDAGDACLRSLADALRAVAQRPTDLLARHGGGSFALLLPATDCQGAAAIADRATRAAGELKVAADYRVTLSIGIACHQLARSTLSGTTPATPAVAAPGAAHAADLLAAAEHAVILAKAAGGRTAFVVDPADFGSSADSALASQG
jgi:diguanylate cyclase (GGDEF)-like protein